MRDRRTIGIVAASAIALLVLLWIGGSQNYASCVKAAEVKYPSVPVSAFVTEDPGEVGPLKASFVNERADAVDDCSRFF